MMQKSKKGSGQQRDRYNSAQLTPLTQFPVSSRQSTKTKTEDMQEVGESELQLDLQQLLVLELMSGK